MGLARNIEACMEGCMFLNGCYNPEQTSPTLKGRKQPRAERIVRVYWWLASTCKGPVASLSCRGLRRFNDDNELAHAKQHKILRSTQQT